MVGPKSSQEALGLVSVIEDTGRSLGAQSTPGPALEEEGQLLLLVCSRSPLDVVHQAHVSGPCRCSGMKRASSMGLSLRLGEDSGI